MMIFGYFLLLSFFFCGQNVAESPKKVTTHLSAKWTETSFILETMEYLYDYDVEGYWELVNLSTQEASNWSKMTDKEVYQHILSFCSRYLQSTQINLLKLALSLRNQSPKIETFQQIARDRGVHKLNCPVVVELGNHLSCIYDESQKFSGIPEILKIDHPYIHDDSSLEKVAFLYGDPRLPEFKSLHEKLKAEASAGNIRYFLRPFINDRGNKKVRISGYGVELQIKSTEYKAQDDRKVQSDSDDESEDKSADSTSESVIEGFDFKKLSENYPEDEEKLQEFKQFLKDKNNDMAPMKVWQIQDLSMQASERIMSSPAEERLGVLEDLSTNFPSHARSLSRIKVSKELKKEIRKNTDSLIMNLNLQTSDSALYINGIHFDMDYSDIFSIFETLKSEGDVLDGLARLGLDEAQAQKMISLDFGNDGEKTEYGLDIRDDSVKWINNLEKDSIYKGWSKDLDELLRPTFPGMLRSIRKNLYNVVVFIDPSKRESAEILKMLESFYVHRTPIRIGLVFVLNEDPLLNGNTDAGVAFFVAFNYIFENKSPYDALSFITDVYSKKDGFVDVELIKETFLESYQESSIFEAESEYDIGRVASNAFALKTGFKRFPQALLNGVPLDIKNPEDFEENLMRGLMKQTNKLQRAVYHSELSESDDILDFHMMQSNIMPRLNDRILNTENDIYINMNGDDIGTIDLSSFASISKGSMAATLASKLKYLSNGSNDKMYPYSAWILADLETLKGRELFRSALNHLKYSKTLRITLIPTNAKGFGLATKVVLTALSESLEYSSAKSLIGKVLKENTLKSLISGKKKLNDYDIPGVDMKNFVSKVDIFNKKDYEAHQSFVTSGLTLKLSQSAVILNGRLLGPFNDNEDFGEDDFSLLEKFSVSKFGDKLIHAFSTTIKKDPNASNKILKMSSLLLSRRSSKSRYTIPTLHSKHSVLSFEPDHPENPSFDIVAIMDPISRSGQKLSPLLPILRKILNARLRVFLNPMDKHSDLPHKSYFRLVLEPEINFDSETDSRSSGPSARFVGLPTEPIFTMHYHIPDNWLVEPVKSPYDMDNIKLDNVESGIIHAVYELEYLLLEGHCFESFSGSPPRGLQMTLGTRNTPVQMDTIVMANLGYLQLKSNPGRWLLRLREGRSADIYDITSQEGAESLENGDVEVLITSFSSNIVKIRVSKKPDKQKEELLPSGNDKEEKSGLWNSITSTFSSSSSKGDDEKSGEDETLNIFCLASGHLYERLLKIMMLSTIRQTKAPVKFWILKSYLSPSLKEFLPVYAEKYGFQYEYVQYKWPRWLNQQKEKQRIIWGYKILFLDVMFPLDVKKIIFVDTDQIVRADLTELRDLDLGGAPYGYTPFCDSNKEMDGFRFWKSGYWKSHLAGRSYHISAIYVVDLVKFRQIAAGDRLRGQYQALSQDPNSLANLDQDLPNNMIHQVPIKSLPQDWLWCETWCDQKSKATAKSIDLCNNPLTKESKLDAAKRIVKEWPELDEEMQKLTESIYSTKTTSKVDHSEL